MCRSPSEFLYKKLDRNTCGVTVQFRKWKVIFLDSFNQKHFYELKLKESWRWIYASISQSAPMCCNISKYFMTFIWKKLPLGRSIRHGKQHSQRQKGFQSSQFYHDEVCFSLFKSDIMFNSISTEKLLWKLERIEVF